MLAKVLSCAVVGLDGERIEGEIDRGRGLPSFVLVDLPEAAVKESGQRVEAAIKKRWDAIARPLLRSFGACRS